jgi:putative transposase
MPVSKNKRTTSNTDPVGSEQASPVLPPQPTFHEHLRALTRDAVRVVIEEVMREELKQFLGAAWGESTPERKGYRNGSYTRDLATSSGPIEELAVPRDREGQFHTQIFERYQRYEPQVAEGLTQVFVAGVSTHKVGEVAQTLMGVAPSASAVSRLNQNLTEQFEAWRERPLQAHWRILYLDGIHFEVRHGDQTDSTILLTALGVDLEGHKEVLALCACCKMCVGVALRRWISSSPMGTTACWQPFLPSLPPPRVNAVWFIKSATSCVPFPNVSAVP